MGIPVIDLRSAGVPAQLRAAAMDAGFFYIVGHGVDPVLVERQFEQARAFFELPAADKQALSLKHSPARRGYESIGDQRLDADAEPDLKESFYCGIEHAADHPYVRKGYQSYGTTPWPAALPALPAQCEAYIDAMLRLSRRLMALMARSLGLPDDTFDAPGGYPMVTLRLLRYPPHPPQAGPATFGAGAHTDWGALTILAQDAHGGLEVQMPGGRWVPATPIAGSFVVNLGDMVPRWTCGLYRSNPHRVRNVASGGAPRHSIPFFYNPDYEMRVAALPGCAQAGLGMPPEPCTVGEHLREMYEKTYGHAAA